MTAKIRRAAPRDVEQLVALVHELAEYERAPADCHLDADLLATALFDDRPAVFAHVGDVDGQVVGCAVWFLSFSTWTGRHGIYLEDLYVQPAHRRRGIGRRLLARLAAECAAHGYSRLEWSVLDWNSDAIAFYRSLGAQPMQEWTVFRLTGAPLAALGEPPASGSEPG